MQFPFVPLGLCSLRSIYWTILLLHSHLPKSNCLNYKDPGVRGLLGLGEQLLPKKWKGKEVSSFPVSLSNQAIGYKAQAFNKQALVGL